MGKSYDVADMNLAEQGMSRIGWAEREMPVLRLILQRFQEERPLEDVRIGACLHVTTETANLMHTLVAGGAEVALCASNPLSTQDDVAAALVSEFDVSVFAIRGEDKETYYDHLSSVVDHRPQLTMDDGADLVSMLHQSRREMLPHLLGGSEETTTGVIRLRALQEQGKLEYPIIAVNDADTKHLFDNRYGTGQSTIDGIIRATNVLLAGKTFVVCGYGWCSRGIAMRAEGMGANVVVTEVDPLRGLQAVMDGYRVMPMVEAAPMGDIFVSSTGDINVVDVPHFRRMKDGAILANSGHFNVEINLEALEEMASDVSQPRELVKAYTLEDGRRIYVLAEGRLVNLAAAEGHPSAVMDMSFANQALCAEYMVQNHQELEREVYPVPADIDRKVARLKLEAMDVEIDVLTEEQEAYLSSWELGT
ncbi:MAG: adenosylhomocysteinase [Anaerolineae bacterium]